MRTFDINRYCTLNRRRLIQGLGAGLALTVGDTALRACRGRGPGAGTRLLLPLYRRQRGQPGRPHQDPADPRRSGGPPPVRRLRLPALRGLYTAFQHLAEEDLDFVFHYGDYIYEYRHFSPADRPAMVRDMPEPYDEIYTLDDYRNRYATYKANPLLQAAHQSAPFLMSWDDHEIDNNWAGDLKPDFNDPASASLGCEFVCTSASTGGDGADMRPDTPAVLAKNPHIRFFNNQRGYLAIDVTPQTWTTHYRVVDYVSQPGARPSRRGAASWSRRALAA
jgi:hypothetical protein